MQNDVLPEPLGPLNINDNGCLNLNSSLMDGQAMTRLSPLFTLPILYPNDTDVLQPIRHVLKNEIVYCLSSGSVTIDTVPTPFLSRLIFISVCTFTGGVHPPCIPYQNHVHDDQFRRVIIEVYVPYFTECLTAPGQSIEHPVCVALWSNTHKFTFRLRGALSEVM